MFYNYIYLDPRKPGEYVYEDLKFDFEPFYVGKGKGNRYLQHLTGKTSSLKDRIIRKLLKLNFDLKKYVIFLNETDDENESYNTEIILINKIGRRNLKKGPLANVLPGGCGQGPIIHASLGKTYEEIYGKERAELEKEKRQKTYFKKGRIVSEEIQKKISKKLKEKTPWNKGKKGVQISWNKGKKFTSFNYTLTNLITNEFYNATGFKELDEVIKKVNKTLPWKERIKKCELLKSIYKNFKLEKTNERKEN